MQSAYVVTGTLSNGDTVILDEPLPVGTGRLRLTVEPLGPAPAEEYHQVMAEIRSRQRARGHQHPSREDVDAALEAERKSWDEP